MILQAICYNYFQAVSLRSLMYLVSPIIWFNCKDSIETLALIQICTLFWQYLIDLLNNILILYKLQEFS